MMGFCSYCGIQQRLLPWACPSCSTTYCSFHCMTSDKIDHAISCMEEPMRKTFSKTYYNQNLSASNSTAKAAYNSSFFSSPATEPAASNNELESTSQSSSGSVISNKYTTLCRFFLQDKCTKGDSCQFSHKRPVCEHYLKNCCRYGENCVKIHPERQREVPQAKLLCSHYQLGRCKFGDDCLKIHQDPLPIERPLSAFSRQSSIDNLGETENKVICEHYLRGKCDFGDKCFKSHDKPPLYKAPYAPICSMAQIEQNFNNVKLNETSGLRRDSYCNMDMIFLSDSDNSDFEMPSKERFNKKPMKKSKTRVSPVNMFEVLEVPNDLSEDNSDKENDENIDKITAKGDSSTNNLCKPEEKELKISNSVNNINDPHEKKEHIVVKISNAEKKKLKKDRKKAAAIEANVCKIDSLKEQGDFQYQQNYYNAAVKLYSDAIKLCGANNPMPSLYNNRAAACLMLDNFKAALSDGRKVVELEPGNTKAHHRIVRCCISLGKVEEARVSLAEINSNPSDALNEELKEMEAQLNKIEQLKEEILKLVKGKKFKQAEDSLDEALDICSQSIEFILLRAQVLALQMDVMGARKQLDKLDMKDPSTKTCRYHYVQGLCAYYGDDLDRAISGFAEAKKELSEVKLWHDKAMLIQNAIVSGNKALKVGSNYEAAKTSFNKALDADPEHTKQMSKLFYKRALINEKFDKISDALEDSSSAISYDPTHHNAWSLRGKLNVSQDLFEEGVKDLTEANKLHSSLENYSQLEEAKRRMEKAGKIKQTHYQVLCVDRKAPLEVIKKAYRAKAREFHPDKHANAAPEEQEKMESKMKEIAAAHSCLSDPEKRAVYDRKLERMMNDSSDGCDESCDDEDYEFDIDDFFVHLFGKLFMNTRVGRFKARMFHI